MEKPLVSVICLCYNQAEYVARAIQSVWDQNYEQVELIVVDDASTDHSVQVIRDTLGRAPIKFLSLATNQGNCSAFNEGFRNSSGAYIIDLAADDVLLPDRISEGLASFNQSKIGVHFCDSYFINEAGKRTGTHFKRNEKGELSERVPTGDLYTELIRRYFISPPTMMMRRSVLEALGGYDERLSYEDFDFWIRSARSYAYGFTDKILVEKRVLSDSLSDKQFRFRSIHQRSTLQVCRKIKVLNNSEEEDKALKQRVWYEIRQCVRQGNWELIPSFLGLIL